MPVPSSSQEAGVGWGLLEPRSSGPHGKKFILKKKGLGSRFWRQQSPITRHWPCLVWPLLFSIIETKYLTRNNSREEGLLWAYGLRVWSVPRKLRLLGDCEATWSHFRRSGPEEERCSTCLLHFSAFNSLRSAHGTVPPKSRASPVHSLEIL